MITATQRLHLMRAGWQAYVAGLPSTACPYSLIHGREESWRAAIWIRGYVRARDELPETSGSTLLSS